MSRIWLYESGSADVVLTSVGRAEHILFRRPWRRIRLVGFFVFHRYGNAERDAPISIFPFLLDKIDERLDDEEHTSISVIHEGEWGRGVYHGGYVAWENVEGYGEPRHMRNVTRERVLALMEMAATGALSSLEAEQLEGGY